MRTNEAIPILKMLKEMIRPTYPDKYIEAVDTAISELKQEELEYRDEMRV